MKTTAWPSVHEWPTGTQGGHNLRLPWPKVARWIGESVGIPTDQVTLNDVFILRSWSISAHVVARSTPFVFKANCLKIYDDAPRVYRALNELAPNTTPELISHRMNGSALWMLFHYVRGSNVGEIGKGTLLSDTARRVGEIQTGWSKTHASNEFDILDLRVERTTDMLLVLIERLEDQYLCRADDDTAIPVNFIRRLEMCLPDVQARVDEIVDLGWPSTIHHTDLHPGNGLLDHSGNIRILDWDQAAIGFPCDSVYWLESFEDEPPWLDASARQSVKSAYLDTIPWGDSEQRERAWTLGEQIGRIPSAYQSDRQNVALARSEATGANIIRLMTSFLRNTEGRAR